MPSLPSGEVATGEVATGETSSQSVPMDSASELDVAFMADSRHNSPTRSRETSPKTPCFRSARKSPPPHPLLSSLESSPEYHSPAETGKTPARGKSERGRLNRTVIRQLILQTDAIIGADDSDDEPEALTPTPQTVCWPAQEVDTPTGPQYVAQSPLGEVPISLLKTGEPTNEDPENGNRERRRMASSLSDLPSTSSGLRNPHTRSKLDERKARITAASGAAYPQSRVDKAKEARSNSAPEEGSGPVKKTFKRGPDGRFAK